ncbi:MAG: LppX_LprAFG lipoprotein [Anaerolineales bacterium]|nr:LppX_LprAFG lipoprotein [Anaerolineales bacterium]
MKGKAWIFVIIIGIVLVSCGPSQEELDATATKEAADAFATQTALAPTETPTPTVTPLPESNELLDASVRALEEARTFHFEMDMQMSISEEGMSMDIPLTFIGDMEQPDKMQAVMSMSILGMTLDIEMISIGDTTYMTNPETGEWEIGEAGDVSPIDPTLFSDVEATELDTLTVTGVQTLNGIEVYHLEGVVAGEDIGEFSGEFQIDYWIGVEDLLTREIALDGNMSFEEGGLLTEGLSGDIMLTMTMKLSDFGKEVVIEAPEIKMATQVESPYGLMTVYESALYPFTMQYPSDWLEQPPEVGETARFTSDEGGILIIAEEDIVAVGLGEMSLQEYGDLTVSFLETSTFGFELIGHEEFVTDSGLPAELISFTIQDGLLEVRRFIYVLDDRIGFNATYLVPDDRFEALDPIILYSLGTFNVGETITGMILGTEENPVIWGFVPFGVVSRWPLLDLRILQIFYTRRPA